VEEGGEVQPEELICEISVGAVEPYIFPTDNCCMNTGIISAKEGQFLNTVIKHVFDEVLILEIIRREKKHISVEMTETKLSIEDNPSESLRNNDYIKDVVGNEESCDKILAEIELLEKFLGEHMENMAIENKWIQQYLIVEDTL